MSGRFFWLASYPKSGNTWLRLFLANLTQSEEPVGINAIQIGSLDNVRSGFDALIGMDSDLLDHDAVDALRAASCRLLARQSRGRLYFKTHDAYRQDAKVSVFPRECTEAAIYVVRNPFDLSLSWAAFFDKNIDEAIVEMNTADFALSSKADRFQPLLRQRIGSWSAHVRSWLDLPDFPVCVVRYEDMVFNPEVTFARIGAFVSPGISADRIERAWARTCFAELQAQEQAHGFRENQSSSARFFRNGKVGEWRSTLTQDQVERITGDHFELAQKLGYLDAAGQPVW